MVSSTRTTAIADPSAQFCASRNCDTTRDPAIRPCAPPRISGVTYSPISGMNDSSRPATIPGIARGSVTLKNVRTRPAPRSLLASRSAGSSRSSATKSGKIISGR
jgi:hypothetical protein